MSEYKGTEELTVDEMDKLTWTYCGPDPDAAVASLRGGTGTVWTQVDGDEDIGYVRGLRLVNRTGWYVAVKEVP